MPKTLSKTEIAHRLQQLRNITMLHERALAKVARLEALLAEKDTVLVSKDACIAELEVQLLSKEASA